MRKDAPGYSLVETAAVAAVVAIACGLALPSFKEALRRHRVATAMHLVSAQLAQARSTAVARGVPVTLCPSRGDGRCSGGTDWSAGWVLYLDPDRSDQPRSQAAVLRDVRRPLPRDVRVVASAGRVRVRYQQRRPGPHPPPRRAGAMPGGLNPTQGRCRRRKPEGRGWRVALKRLRPAEAGLSA